MNTISTYVFDFVSPATSSEVFAALTHPEQTAFFGMTAESTWQPEAPLVFRPPGAALYGTIAGEVLAADAPRRLSYSISSGEGHPATYVTWEITEADGESGARVRLYVDETETGGRDVDEALRVWWGVISALQAVLAGGRSADASV